VAVAAGSVLGGNGHHPEPGMAKDLRVDRADSGPRLPRDGLGPLFEGGVHWCEKVRASAAEGLRVSRQRRSRRRPQVPVHIQGKAGPKPVQSVDLGSVDRGVPGRIQSVDEGSEPVREAHPLLDDPGDHVVGQEDHQVHVAPQSGPPRPNDPYRRTASTLGSRSISDCACTSHAARASWWTRNRSAAVLTEMKSGHALFARHGELLDFAPPPDGARTDGMMSDVTRAIYSPALSASAQHPSNPSGASWSRR